MPFRPAYAVLGLVVCALGVVLELLGDGARQIEVEAAGHVEDADDCVGELYLQHRAVGQLVVVEALPRPFHRLADLGVDQAEHLADVAALGLQAGRVGVSLVAAAGVVPPSGVSGQTVAGSLQAEARGADLDVGGVHQVFPLKASTFLST